MYDLQTKALARFNEYRDTQRLHDDADTDGSKMYERFRQRQSSTAISRMLRQPNLPTPVQKTTRQQHHLCYWGYIHHTGTELLHVSAHDPPVHHDGVVSSGSMSCFQAIQGADIVSHFISHNLNLLWLLSGKVTCSFLLDTKSLWHWGKWKWNIWIILELMQFLNFN